MRTLNLKFKYFTEFLNIEQLLKAIKLHDEMTIH